MSLIFIFIIGIILLAGMALLPPYLQTLMNYPVMLTGIILAPRGLGTMLAMFLVGRLTGKIDARILIASGLLLTAYSLHQMSQFSIEVPASLIIHTGIIQGFGMGFVFVPLSTLAYSTLAPHYRNEAAAIFSLMRNIGSSVGISIVMTLLARNTQISHSDLVSHLLPFGNTAYELQAMTEAIKGQGSEAVMGTLNGMVTKQASAIAYLNDYLFMMYVVLLAMPLLFFLKAPKVQAEQSNMNANVTVSE